MKRILLVAFVLIVATMGFGPTKAADKLVDETVTVPALNYRYYSFVTNGDNVRVVVEVDVLSGNDINVYIMDDTNYALWTGDQTAETYLNKQLVGSFNAEATLGDEGRYYVILDNTYSLLTSKQIHVVIEVKPSVGTELFFIIVILGIIGAVAVGGFLLWRRRKRQPTPPPGMPMQAQAPVTPSPNMIYCPNCGARVNLPAKFCDSCGSAINT